MNKGIETRAPKFESSSVPLLLSPMRFLQNALIFSSLQTLPFLPFSISQWCLWIENLYPSRGEIRGSHGNEVLRHWHQRYSSFLNQYFLTTPKENNSLRDNIALTKIRSIVLSTFQENQSLCLIKEVKASNFDDSFEKLTWQTLQIASENKKGVE